MNDDRFMKALRAEPRPEFARALRERLAAEDAASEGEEAAGAGNAAAAPARPRFRLFPGFATAAAALAVASLFLFPSVRASAQAFLDLFRVRSFTAVPFDPARMERFRSIEKDMSLVILDRQATEPRASDVPSRTEAEGTTGIPVLEPSYLPDGMVREKLQTVQYDRVRISTSTEKIRTVLDALDLRDVDVPLGLDGQWADVQLYPAAFQRWSRENRHVELIQARSPEVSLPAGLDLARLAEIGLRILGLDRGEAGRIARSVDWHSTLLVPVPANASGFREVTVRGQRGLLVTTAAMDTPDGRRARDGSILLWTEGDRVLALSGNIESSEVMEIAESLR